MSIKIMSEVWHLDLDKKLKFTLLAYADHANDDGICYPSKERIAWKCGLGKRTVDRQTDDLMDRDLLALIEEGGGRGNSNTYRVQPEKGVKLTPFTEKNPVNSDENPVTHAKNPVTNDRGTTTRTKGTVKQPPPNEVVGEMNLRKKLRELDVNQIEETLAAVPDEPPTKKIMAAIGQVEDGSKSEGHLVWALQNLDIYTPPDSIQREIESEQENKFQSEMDRIVSLVATRNDLENEPLPQEKILENEHISEDALERLLEGRLQRCSEGFYLPTYFDDSSPSEESFIEHLEKDLCPYENPVEFARENNFSEDAIQLAQEIADS